jgi:Fanconi-associated nuclease 1
LFLNKPLQKEKIVNALLDHAAGQRTLPALAKHKGKTKSKGKSAYKSDGMVQTQLSFSQKPLRDPDGMVQTQLSFAQNPKDVSQMKRLREMVMNKLGMRHYQLAFHKGQFNLNLTIHRSMCQN